MLSIQIIDGKPATVVTCDKCAHQIEGDDGVVLFEKPGAALHFFHRDCEDEDAHQGWLAVPLDLALYEAFKSLNSGLIED
jgi:hypothetical protein